MKKELNYLSCPDYLSKYLYINYNQKFNIKDKIYLQFKLSDTKNIGSAIKAIYLLEYIFPRKTYVYSFKIKKKKNYLNQKKKDTIIFKFNLNLNANEFVEFFRFFAVKPLKLNFDVKTEVLPLINRKLKLFDFNFEIKIMPLKKLTTNSFFFFKNYHLE